MAKENIKKQLDMINRDLRELEQIKADLEKAKRAGVPDLEELCFRCDHAKESLSKYKREYFPNEV